MTGEGQRTGVAARWPEGVGVTYVAVPVLLLQHAATLGLSDGHVRLLLAIESYRFGDGAEAVHASQATLADRCGCSEDQVQRRVAHLLRLGLIEVQRHPRPGGKRLNHYTRHGLDRALAALVQPAADTASSPGTAESNTADPPGTYTADPPGSYTAPARCEEEAVEEEEGKHAAGARDLADRVLADFNRRAETDYPLDGKHGREVIARVAAHPALTEEDFTRILDAAFVKPWWRDAPSPLVIFSAAQFEQARQALHARWPGEIKRARFEQALAKLQRPEPEASVALVPSEGPSERGRYSWSRALPSKPRGQLKGQAEVEAWLADQGVEDAEVVDGEIADGDHRSEERAA